ncbi:MAG TPA: hypothetical protein VGE20_21240 [Ramlibacter sp.]
MTTEQPGPQVKWVLHPADGGRLVKLDVPAREQHVPAEGDVIVRPFLVDAATMRPIPVRVVQRLEWHHSGNASFVVVVRCSG